MVDHTSGEVPEALKLQKIQDREKNNDAVFWNVREM